MSFRGGLCPTWESVPLGHKVPRDAQHRKELRIATPVCDWLAMTRSFGDAYGSRQVGGLQFSIYHLAFSMKKVDTRGCPP